MPNSSNSNSKPGRNDPCWCGSGYKYKKCCLELDQQRESGSSNIFAPEVEKVPVPFDASGSANDEPSTSEVTELEVDHEEDLELHGGVELPPIDPAAEQLIENWWEEVAPIYGSDELIQKSDWLLKKAVGFLDEHPQLFPYLGLEDEYLLELGCALVESGNAGGYFNFLNRIREEQPLAYHGNAEFFDRDLIVEHVRTGELNKIVPLFNLLHADPYERCVGLREVAELLAWQGLETELQELLNPLAKHALQEPPFCAESFWGGWVYFIQIQHALDVGDDSPEGLFRSSGWLAQRGIQDFLDEESRQRLQRILRFARRDFAESGLDLRKSDDEYFHADLGWNFIGWLKRTGGHNWVRSKFLNEMLQDYWDWYRSKNKHGTSRFGLDTRQIRRYLNELSEDEFVPYGIRQAATIQSIHYFSDYLVACNYLSKNEARRIHSECYKLFTANCDSKDILDPALRIHPIYDGLIQSRGVGVNPKSPSA